MLVSAKLTEVFQIDLNQHFKLKGMLRVFE